MPNRSSPFELTIEPHWTVRAADGRTLGARVLQLLVGVDQHGSLAAACTADGLSYRHAWQLLREAEDLFGEPVLVKSRGRGSQLTPLGAKLVWGHRRVQARLSPVLDTLASELRGEIARVLSSATDGLRIHASHGFAVQALHESLTAAGVAHTLKYCPSAEALAALKAGQCDLAGFHVPLGAFEAEVAAHYRPWFDLREQRVIVLSTRRQGLMVAPGNPKKIYDIADLARPEVRFINRQPGSGTRDLLDRLLQRQRIVPAQVRGYEQCEFTHAAVAAFVASGMADVGLGLEVPARNFRLEFMPCQQERYFLLTHAERLRAPDLQQLLGLLAEPALHAAIDRLPGYTAAGTGTVMALDAAFPSLAEAPAALDRGGRAFGAARRACLAGAGACRKLSDKAPRKTGTQGNELA